MGHAGAGGLPHGVLPLPPPEAATRSRNGSATGTAGLHSHSDALDRTAVRPWWPRRAAQLVALTALAAGLLLAAGAAALIDARLSWLPVTVYAGAAWAVAAALFVCGGGLYASCGARPDGARD
ncbi:hypothetical protein [Streptomyces formicae]